MGEEIAFIFLEAGRHARKDRGEHLMPANDPQAIIEEYIHLLDRYTIDQIRYKPEEDVWSIGQMYMHVIDAAEEYLEHIRTCTMETRVEHGSKTDTGMQAFAAHEWPDVRVKLDEPVNSIPTPESKEEILASLDQLRSQIAYWKERIQESNPDSKIHHGWFGWLNACEWFEMIDLHSRNHLRQLARLNEKLAEAGLLEHRFGVRDTLPDKLDFI